MPAPIPSAGGRADDGRTPARPGAGEAGQGGGALSPARGTPTPTGPEAYRAWRASPLGRITDACEAAALQPLLGTVAGLDLLDIGCGDGMLAADMAMAGARVIGIDPDAAMLEAARPRAAGHGFHLVRGRIEALPFAAGSFDLVTAVTVLCFVRDETAAWREMARILRPGGALVIGELGRWSLWALRRRVRGWLGSRLWRDVAFHSAAQLRRAAGAAGLSVEEVRGAVFHPPSAFVARLTAGLDARLGRRTSLGAAFIALRARKPGVRRAR
ncbi:MAG: methyltransferase domain-containing protein [Alphaproteobacteria bacterium]|nr:methyltransferase domain-containing protein [Alphaproteobacteria bacterium]